MLCPQIYNLDEMEKFLERCNLLKLTKEETGNPKKLISIKEIESMIIFHNRMYQVHMGSLMFGFYQTFKEGIIPIFYNLYYEDAAAAAKSLQLCPTLCDPIDGSP